MEPGALFTAHLSQDRGFPCPCPYAPAGWGYRAGWSDRGNENLRAATCGARRRSAAGCGSGDQQRCGARGSPGSLPVGGRGRSGGRDPAADPTRAAEAVRVRSCRLACDPRLTRFAQPEVQTLCPRQVASWRRSARPAAGPCGPLLRGSRATCLARRRLQRIRLDARSLFGTHHGDMNRVRDSGRGAPSQAAGPSRPLPTPCTCIRGSTVHIRRKPHQGLREKGDKGFSLYGDPFCDVLLDAAP